MTLTSYHPKNLFQIDHSSKCKIYMAMYNNTSSDCIKIKGFSSSSDMRGWKEKKFQVKGLQSPTNDSCLDSLRDQ